MLFRSDDVTYFPEKRFQFLVEWDPDALVRHSAMRCSPLSRAAYAQPLHVIESIFAAGILHHPTQKGITMLFQADLYGLLIDTPFRVACLVHGREQVTKAVENVLIDCPGGNPYDAIEALFVAATDERIHLDGVYFLLRREPDVLAKLLSVECDPGQDSNINEIGIGDSGGESEAIGDTALPSPRKRKHEGFVE